MENIPDPKYKIGDVVLCGLSQHKIDRAVFNLRKQNPKWVYYFIEDQTLIQSDEDQIIKKLN